MTVGDQQAGALAAARTARHRRHVRGGLLGCAAALALVISPAVAEPGAALVDARRHVLDGDTSPVTFRSMDDFFPVALVDHGGVAPLDRRLEDISPDVTLTDGVASFQDALDKTYTNALLVIQDGDIVYELYRNGSDEESRFVSWSMSKSITSLLVGAALERGYIASLDDPIEQYVADYQGTAFEGVSIRNLLTMRHGTSYRERVAEGPSDLDIAVDRSMFRNAAHFADVTGLGLERVEGAEDTFGYSTLVTGVLGRLVEEATGQSLAHFMEDVLWVPAGMEASGYWMLDAPAPEGQAFAGGGYNAVLRDYGRLGLLVLNDGSANGRQVLTSDWIAESTEYHGEAVMPGSPRGYQYQWWTILGTEIVDAIGIHGQFISIDPATNSVIVKLSHDPSPGSREHQINNSAILNAIRAQLAQGAAE